MRTSTHPQESSVYESWFCNKNKENKFCCIYSRYSIDLLLSEHNTEIVSACTSAHNFLLRKYWFISTEFGVSDCTKNFEYLFTVPIPAVRTFNDFLCCESDQIGCGTQPASYSMRTACHFSWGKEYGAWNKALTLSSADITLLHDMLPWYPNLPSLPICVKLRSEFRRFPASPPPPKRLMLRCVIPVVLGQ